MTRKSVSPSQPAFSESVVKGALTSLDLPRLRGHLDGIDAPDWADLAGQIKRSSYLIRKYPDPSFESRRAEFAKQLRSYATSPVR